MNVWNDKTTFVVVSCLPYQFYFEFYLIVPLAFIKFFTVTRLLNLASAEWFHSVIVAEIDPKLWSDPVIAGLPQARVWGLVGDAEMWFASQCPGTPADVSLLTHSK